jgi:hypothetical protein
VESIRTLKVLTLLQTHVDQGGLWNCFDDSVTGQRICRGDNSRSRKRGASNILAPRIPKSTSRGARVYDAGQQPAPQPGKHVRRRDCLPRVRLGNGSGTIPPWWRRLLVSDQMFHNADQRHRRCLIAEDGRGEDGRDKIRREGDMKRLQLNIDPVTNDATSLARSSVGRLRSTSPCPYRRGTKQAPRGVERLAMPASDHQRTPWKINLAERSYAR